MTTKEKLDEVKRLMLSITEDTRNGVELTCDGYSLGLSFEELAFEVACFEVEA